MIYDAFFNRPVLEKKIGFSRRKSKEIFDAYSKKLKEQKKEQLSDDLLPIEWFIKEFAKDKGISEEILRSKFNEKEHPVNENK